MSLNGPEITLDSRAFSVMALVLHELATNAIKYGALGVPGGSLRVSWSLDAEALNLAWDEQGRSGLRVPQQRGFGTEVVERTLTYDLGAETRMAYRDFGVLCEIRLPRAGVVKGG